MLDSKASYRSLYLICMQLYLIANGWGTNRTLHSTIKLQYHSFRFIWSKYVCELRIHGKLQDLLNVDTPSRDLVLKHEGQYGLHIENLTSAQAPDLETALGIVNKGLSNRMMASTMMVLFETNLFILLEFNIF